MRIRDRIIDFRRVPAKDLLPNPMNWRRHPDAQADAMRGVLAEVGFADAVLARVTSDGLMLIDGHLRAEVAPDAMLPVLVLDVTEKEAELILATHDPLAGMAETDAGALGELLQHLETQNGAVQRLFDELAAQARTFDVEAIDMPLLSDEPVKSLEQMTFTLSTEQAGTVRSAIKAAKDQGPFVDTGNENSNGNALARIAESFLGVEAA